MKPSTKVAVLHGVLVCAFLLNSLAAVPIALLWPSVFLWKMALPTSFIYSCVLASWAWHKRCILTIMQNDRRKLELPGSEYEGHCLAYYAKQWRGWHIPQGLVTPVLILLMTIPFAVGTYIAWPV